MKIEICVDEKIAETHIAVSCKYLTPEIEKLLAMLRIMEKKLTVSKGKEIFLLDVSEVMYMEAIDRKTFVYTGQEPYESDFKLEVSMRNSRAIFWKQMKDTLKNKCGLA